MSRPFLFFLLFASRTLVLPSFRRMPDELILMKKAIHLFGGFWFPWLADSSHRSKGKDK